MFKFRYFIQNYITINDNDTIIHFSAGFDRLALGWRVKSKEDGAVSAGNKTRQKEQQGY